MSRSVAEFAFDLHAGLSGHQITEYDDLYTVGMAATLAIHIKGLGQIDYEVLRKVSDHFMAIPSIALEKVLRVLDEIGFVRLVESGRRIEQVIPNIPVFDDVYEQVGAFASSELHLNEHENATLEILGALQNAPRHRDGLRDRLGIDKSVFDQCLKITSASGIVSEQVARGRPMLVSPFYFADNLDGLVDAAVASGANTIQSVLKKIKDNQGWPLSLVAKTGEIGGIKLDERERSLVTKLASEGIIRPPTVRFGEASESFVFTPRPGIARLNASNREVYERAMALISAVRKGQLLPEKYRIRSPLHILKALRERGFLKSNSDAKLQYQNLVVMRVAQLREVQSGRWQLHLLNTDENKAALNLAIDLLSTGALAGMEVDHEARIALSKGEEYVQSLISASELKRRQRQIVSQEAEEEYGQLLLKLE